MDQKRIGKQIFERRKNKNMTQQELANKLNVTNRTIINWENGKCLPDYSLLIPLCYELDISIDELLTGDEDSEHKINKTVEMIINYLDRNKNENLKEYEKFGKILLFGGVLLTIISVQIPPFIRNTYFFGDALVNVYPIIGLLISFLGFKFLNKKYSFKKRFFRNSLFLGIFIAFLLISDIYFIKNKSEVSRYHMSIITNNGSEGIIYVETPFYDTYSCYDWNFKIILPSVKRYNEDDAEYLRNKYCKEIEKVNEEGE